MAVVANPAFYAIVCYCVSSILMTVTNKLVLSSYEFRLNFFLLAVQSLVCVLMLEGFLGAGLISRRKFKVDDAKKWFIVSLALVAMIYTGARALAYLSIPLFTIFKNITIILIAYCERILLAGSPVTPLMLVAFAMMVSSSLIAGWSDLQSHGAIKQTSGEAEISPAVAVAWMAANCATTAGFALLMKKKIKEVGFKEFDTVFYNNALSIPVLLVASLLTERSTGAATWAKYTANPEYEGQMRGLMFGIILSGISSFGISYSTAWCMRVTSSTTYSMVGALNKLPIAVAGMLFFDDNVTLGGVCGVVIAFLAGIVYSHAKNMQNSAGVKPTSSLPLPAMTHAERVRKGAYDKVAES
ncbi:GDP-mannose transporter into the lumen of the Golgi [Geranomyces variabilis]|nr:GDP-mannose transporter into the lumen of the Golgi [Geranomyces variabilis]